jgi:hypothetical protein
MFRIKTLFGERLMAREFDRQAVEAGIRVSALNTFTLLGMPESISSSYLRYGRCDLTGIITFIYFSMCYNYFDPSVCHIK